MFWNQDDILSSPYAEGETEALQTDIQRFIAILGFCLMAIFALVQAIPVTSPEKDTVIEDLSHKVDVQNEELVRLRSENERMKNEIERLIQYAGATRSLKEELNQARSDLREQKDRIDHLIKEKIVQEKDLIAYKRQLDERDQKIKELEGKRSWVEELVEKARESLKARMPEKERLEERPKRIGQEKGLYVAFESDRVFMDLLRTEKISLYISVMDVGQGFRVLQKDGKIDFETGGPAQDLDLWEVRETMIPSQILEGFRAWTTLASRKKVLIVGLSPEISSQIRGRKATSGSFIIRSGGRVTYSTPGG